MKPGVTVMPPPGVERQARDDGRTVRLRSAHEGERYVELECDGRRSRVALQWHAPLPEIVRRRARYVLDHQRAPHRPGAAAGALVPIDTETGLTVPGAGWNDFSDARERIGMGLLLQQVLARGWGDDRDEVADAVAKYRRFLLELVITDDGRARSSSHGRAASDRLYDLPWLMLFLLGGDTAAEDVERAKTMFDRYYADGGDTFLAIGIGVAARELVAGLRRPGRRADADAVAERLIAHARGVLDLDAELPAHEVAYEQSIVAPMLEIFCVAAELTDDEAERGRLTDAIVARLPWLLAFGGRQPHVRMRDIAIRHWDGYWFGRERLWGDVFPHHWSALTANVLMLLPPVGRGRGGATARMLGPAVGFPDLRGEPDRLPLRRRGHRRVRDAELRLRPTRPSRRPDRQRSGLGAVLAALLLRRPVRRLIPCRPADPALIRDESRPAFPSCLKSATTEEVDA